MNNIERVIINIKGKEYSFLKPLPITMVNLEKQCMNAKYPALAYEEGLLRIVSKDLKKEDLVEFKGESVKLSNGVVLTPLTIAYSKYEIMLAEFEKDDMFKIVKNFIEICGAQDVVTPESLTKDDIYAIVESYSSIYDRTVLDDVLNRLATFC